MSVVKNTIGKMSMAVTGAIPSPAGTPVCRPQTRTELADLSGTQRSLRGLRVFMIAAALKAVEKLHGLLSLRRSGEYGAFVIFKHLKPVGNVTGVILAN